jgi:DNA-binding CsgD family transcriptional regulator
MQQLVLGERGQRALRTLLSAEPLPGTPLMSNDVLEALSCLIGCDAVGVGLADSTGRIVDSRALPRQRLDDTDPQVCDGPLWLGLIHVSRMPGSELAAHGTTDELWLGFRNGTDHVAQLWLARRRSSFDERDKAMLRMVAPALRRLMRERPAPSLPASLTLQERRALSLVAAGFSNGEIAERLGVATCTVRKHLEHAYPKLGVTNRLAAAVALRGGAAPPPPVLAKVSAAD